MSAEYAPYVLTKPLHGSQKKVEETEVHVIISIEVIPTWELINRILALGSEVEVLSPPSFRNTMVTVIRKMLSHYRKKR
jgi:predicted DNA-binding transcriptional regulator YafY